LLGIVGYIFLLGPIEPIREPEGKYADAVP
jgi:hypothetical protein